MKKIFLKVFIYQLFMISMTQSYSEELKIRNDNSNSTRDQNYEKVYFAGGCFGAWKSLLIKQMVSKNLFQVTQEVI